MGQEALDGRGTVQGRISAPGPCHVLLRWYDVGGCLLGRRASVT